MRAPKLIRLVIDYFSGDVDRDKQLRAEWFIREFKAGFERTNDLFKLNERKRDTRNFNSQYNSADLGIIALAVTVNSYALGALIISEGMRYMLNQSYRETLDRFIEDEQKEIGLLRDVSVSK